VILVLALAWPGQECDCSSYTSGEKCVEKDAATTGCDRLYDAIVMMRNEIAYCMLLRESGLNRAIAGDHWSSDPYDRHRQFNRLAAC